LFKIVEKSQNKATINLTALIFDSERSSE